MKIEKLMKITWTDGINNLWVTDWELMNIYNGDWQYLRTNKYNNPQNTPATCFNPIQKLSPKSFPFLWIWQAPNSEFSKVSQGSTAGGWRGDSQGVPSPTDAPSFSDEKKSQFVSERSELDATLAKEPQLQWVQLVTWDFQTTSNQ